MIGSGARRHTQGPNCNPMGQSPRRPYPTQLRPRPYIVLGSSGTLSKANQKLSPPQNGKKRETSEPSRASKRVKVSSLYATLPKESDDEDGSTDASTSEDKQYCDTDLPDTSEV